MKMGIKGFKRTVAVAGGGAFALCVVMGAQSTDRRGVERQSLAAQTEANQTWTYQAGAVYMIRPTAEADDAEGLQGSEAAEQGWNAADEQAARGPGTKTAGMSARVAVIGTPPALALGGVGLVMTMVMRRRWDKANGRR